MNRFILTISLLSFFSFSVSISNAQNKVTTGVDKSLSLQEAVDFAVKNSAETKNALIDIEIAKKKVWETTAMGLPQITGKIAYQNQFQSPEISFGKYLDPRALPYSTDAQNSQYLTAGDIAGAYKDSPPMALGVVDNTTFDLTASQLIFSGEYLVGLQATKVFKLLSEQGLKKVESDIKEAVTNTYQLVLITQQSKLILDSSLTNMGKIVSEMDQLQKKGFVDETDVDQLRLTEANLKNSISSIERQIEVAKNLLKMQMGMPMEQNIILTDKLDNIIAGISSDNFSNQKFDATVNINFQMIETQEKLAKLNLKRHQSNCLPTIAAFYRHQEMQKEPSFNFNPKDIVGINIDIPIFASGMRHVKIQQDKLELQKIQNTKEKVSQGLTVEYTQALAAYNTAIDKYKREKDNLVLSKKIYDKTVLKKKAGVSTSLEVSQTQGQYLQTQGLYFQAMFEVLNAKNKIEKVLSSAKGK